MNVKFHILIIASLLLFGCTKSEVTGTADGTTPIGFETYIGRDAQTKAASYGKDNLPASVGVYGFYSGAKTWAATDNPNLWANLLLTNNSGTWSYDQNQVRYWVNSQDNYTFLSYAPYATGATGNGLVASTGANPTLTYTVPEALSNQIDLLYSNTNKNIHKPTTGTSVTLDHKHALSRLTVKANAVMYDKKGAVVTTPAEGQEYDHTYTITGITISGKFNTVGTLNLNDGTWNINSTADASYDITGTARTLNADLYDFSAGDNYLTMIPVEFTAESPAVIEVTYKISFAGVESDPITKSVEVATDFVQGNAYSINLTFQRENNNTISFVVESIDGWGDGGTVENENEN